MQNLNVICTICGKKHWVRSCYKESGVCFGCGKFGHMIRDCLEKKKFVIGKPKDENKEDKQEPKFKGHVFAITY